MCSALNGALRPGGRRSIPNREGGVSAFHIRRSDLAAFPRGGRSTEGSPMLKSLAVRRMRPLGV
jgi:hypothetical protein